MEEQKAAPAGLNRALRRAVDLLAQGNYEVFGIDFERVINGRPAYKVVIADAVSQEAVPSAEPSAVDNNVSRSGAEREAPTDKNSINQGTDGLIQKVTLTKTEAAAYTGLHPNTLYRNRDKIPCLKIGKTILYRKETIDNYLKQKEGSCRAKRSVK